MTMLIAVGLAIVALTFFLMVYNGLVTLKNNVARAWSNIDVLLKQRYDELPKLVALCERYMKHERETLEAVINARSRISQIGGGEETGEAQNMLSSALKSLFSVSENYPELKADTNFLQLQSRISSLEDEIADRREFYNDSVNLYNIGIEKMPDAFIARFLNYAPKRMWKINPAHREDVKIKFSS
jgi:LemA protein